ncbi:unnamed protein product [Durusdinium trenchii]|uniref:EF-hand domain-containing protein n=1 Tax=Durusdinium trenchii TaxID=1381693 RepID=A0ABP0M1X0_9DINO
MSTSQTSIEELSDAILRRADERLGDLCRNICRQVTVELEIAAASLVRKVQENEPIHDSAVTWPTWPNAASRRAPTMAWAEPVQKTTSEYEPRLVDYPLPLSTSRALLELQDEGAELPTIASPGSHAPTKCQVAPSSEGAQEDKDGEGFKHLQRSMTKGSKKAGTSGAAERIFGLVPQTSMDEQSTTAMSGWRLRMRKVIRNSWFDCFVMSMVLLHSLLTGIETHVMSTSDSLNPGPVYTVLNLLFCILFAVEVSLRLYVYRLRFFTMYGCAWNILDLIVTLFHCFEEFGSLVATATATTEIELTNSSILRTIRILRGIKVMRLVRFIRYAEELQLIVSCLILSFRTFLWSIGLLLMTFYVMAIYTTQAAKLHRLEFPESLANTALERWWGGIFTSMLSVLQALSGGVDWNDIVQPLITISPAFAVLFIVYLGFCFFALMNVITGTYVETVSRQASDLKTRSQILQARRVFQAIDQDHSGFISLEEIRSQTATAVVLDFFESVDVDPSEAQYLLEVLDMDGSGTINFEEFLHGTLRLNSSARAADLLLVAREMKRFFKHSNLELQLIKKHLGIR